MRHLADFEQLEIKTVRKLVRLYEPLMGDRKFDELFTDESTLTKIVGAIYSSDNQDDVMLRFGKECVEKSCYPGIYGNNMPEWIRNIADEELERVSSLTGLIDLLRKKQNAVTDSVDP